MIIEINDLKKIHEVQEEFSTRFPFLKLEFFRTPHQREEPSNETPYAPDLPLKEIRDKHVHGIITIDAQSETGAIEKEFERRFGLNVQIYRRQLDRWIQTAGTDILTLKEQNEIARDSTIFYNPDHKLNQE